MKERVIGDSESTGPRRPSVRVTPGCTTLHGPMTGSALPPENYIKDNLILSNAHTYLAPNNRLKRLFWYLLMPDTVMQRNEDSMPEVDGVGGKDSHDAQDAQTVTSNGETSSLDADTSEMNKPTEEKLLLWSLLPLTVALCATLFCVSLVSKWVCAIHSSFF